MHCPKCGTQTEITRTITRPAFTVRLRQCSNQTCRTRFVTKEAPGDPRDYRRLVAEDAFGRRNRPRRRPRAASSATSASPRSRAWRMRRARNQAVS